MRTRASGSPPMDSPKPDPVLTPEGLDKELDWIDGGSIVLSDRAHEHIKASHEALCEQLREARADAAAGWQQAKEEHEDFDKTFQQLRDMEGQARLWISRAGDLNAENRRLHDAIGALTPEQWLSLWAIYVKWTTGSFPDDTVRPLSNIEVEAGKSIRALAEIAKEGE